MKKKIILVFIEAPVPFGGAASRWYFTLLSELKSSAEFEIDVFAACANKAQLDEAKIYFPLSNLYLYPNRSGIFKKFETLFKPFSYTISDQMKIDFNQSLNKGYDVIHIEQTFASWILDEVNSKCLLSIHYLSAIDLKNVTYKNFKERVTTHLMKYAEKKLIGRFTNIKSCSNRIEKFVQAWFPDKSYSHFPFGIDSSKYHYLSENERTPTNTITLIASMGWYPGKSAAIRLLERLWPKLKVLNPSMKLRIVGWGARGVLSQYLNLVDVEILENVPSIDKYFYESDLLIYTPTQGSGLKIKIQEAMLLGTPVVTNSEGIEGIDAIHGTHALVAEDDEELINLTTQLFNDRELQRALRENARNLIEKSCSGTVTVNQVKELYKKIIATSL